MFLDSFVLPGVQLYSLQKGPPAAELKAVPHAPIIDLGPMIEDFADAAAMVAELDLIIMTDSAVAHLAGAMGKPVWVLLNHAPYWIWGDWRTRLEWYDSVRLFRQNGWRDWAGVFDACVSDLLDDQSFSGRLKAAI
jgi:hypothetical protein